MLPPSFEKWRGVSSKVSLMPKISLRVVRALKPRPNEYFVWDSELKRFGIRVKPSGVMSYLVQYRTDHGRTRRLTIGRITTLTPDEARKLAREKLAEVERGNDPSSERHERRRALTVGELCDQYLGSARAGLVLTRFGRSKRNSTVQFDQGRIDRHIRPILGQKIAATLTRVDVQKMADAISAGKTAGTFKGKLRGKAVVTGGAGTAARVVGLLGGIWTWAIKRGLVDGTNPAHGIEKVGSGTRDRVLTREELAGLGSVLRDKEYDQPAAVAVIRLIALTGLRRQEACQLKWREIDQHGHCLRLEDTKTGRSTRVIGSAAMKLLQSLPEGKSEFVFAAERSSGAADLKKRMARIFEDAGIRGVRAQVLRRTFASLAADEGLSDATIGELLGHARRGVTERHYIRRADPVLAAAADNVSKIIASALDGNLQVAEVIPMPVRAQGETYATSRSVSDERAEIDGTVCLARSIDS